MNSKSKSAILIAITISLSACGGSDNNPAGVDYFNDTLLNEDYGTGIEEVTRAELGTASASLSGNIAFGNEVDPELTIGDLSLDANFDTGVISGTADGFKTYELDEEASSETGIVLSSTDPVEEFTGFLTVDGNMDVGEVTYTGTIDGVLTDSSDLDYTVDTDIALAGFANHVDDGLITTGVSAGTVTPDGEDPIDTVGIFFAQED